MSEFIQDGPRLGHPYRDDAVLRRLLVRVLPAAMFEEIEPGLERLGARAAGEMLALAEEAETNPPRHVPFDAWGRRVDRIELAPAWTRLHAIAAEEGIVALAYERAHGALSRVHQFARLYLYHPSSAIASCPLAMTDGAARAIELFGDEALRARAMPHLLARDPARFWTSGQWMTERIGGSDVGESETIARPDGRGGFRLNGTKWFTSAVTAEVALALARIEGAPAGSPGLSMFYLELRDAQGALADLRILRLKDKLGTRALPTAELELLGTPARLVGREGRGVPTIATMLNITRLYNSCCAAGDLGRALALARDGARRRRAFGQLLADQPLHLDTLAGLAAEHAGTLHLTFHAAELLGRDETGAASAEERALLRLLTPLAKLSTARAAVAGVTEAIECFGGAAYVEDTGLPRLLRNTHVLPIWEGTTNVLALDALRAIAEEDALAALAADFERQLAGVRDPALAEPVHRLRQSATALLAWFHRTAGVDGAALEAGARAFALGLARTYTGALLAVQAEWELAQGDGAVALATARRWRHCFPERKGSATSSAAKRSSWLRRRRRSTPKAAARSAIAAWSARRGSGSR